MNELIEIENIYPTNIDRSILRSNQKSRKATMKVVADTICRGIISDEYINWAFNRFDKGFVYHRYDNPFAFCIWQEDLHKDMTTGIIKDRGIKILLLCAEKSEFKVADFIFNDLTSYCSRHDYRYITLEPLNKEIREYYKKYGFIDDINPRFMIKPIEILNIKSTRKTLKKKRNTNNISNKLNIKDI